MRWELIDKFEVLRKGAYSKAVKRFTGEEDFFAEHFPGKPLVPEPLFLEMIAQAGGVLYGLSLDFKKEVILAKIAQADLTKAVSPPCDLVVEATVHDEREEGAWITGTVSAEGEKVAEADILLVTMDALVTEAGPSIVFSKKFLNHYDIYNIASKNGR